MTDLVLVTHGTREYTGALVAADIVVALRTALPGVRVHRAFADVRAPNVTDVLRAVRVPAVVVPAFLSSGYHVRVDIPGQVARSGHPDVVLADPPGPAAALVDAAHDRLRAAGLRRGDGVVLAAAGSSDSRALADVERAAAQLSTRTGSAVRIGYLTTARPSLAEAVAGVGRRVAVASWLLAPGLFHRWVTRCGAPVIADPIGAHPLLVKELAARYRAACAHRTTARTDDHYVTGTATVSCWRHRDLRRRQAWEATPTLWP
ncbi:MAG TPA: CbiX/SirB N-terminal domain-containing protein [Pseudonocardiaceae bacterium]|jgi:sirohydrochlorin ferrochelatase|nr:CbiX/SirB N-terminal domain-containing protein [Pseudonocardiaceae bacterium]